jgi:ketosteroid isomerase-like protein
MAHSNEDVVREGFAAFERGDMDALRKQYWTDDIRWHVPGRSPLSGDYEGPEQVIQYFARIFEATGGTLGIELHDVLANDEHAAALYTASGERGGKQLTDNEVQIYHFRDGKVSEAWTYATDQYAADEFFS